MTMTQALAVLYAELDEALDDIDVQYQLSSTDDPEIHTLVIKAASIVTKIQELKNGNDGATNAKGDSPSEAARPADLGAADLLGVAGSE